LLKLLDPGFRRDDVKRHFGAFYEFVPIHKWPICPISALREKFNPRNINHMPPVKFFVRLDLDQICLFVDGHEFIIFNISTIFRSANHVPVRRVFLPGAR
jgi:hypothetical protein